MSQASETHIAQREMEANGIVPKSLYQIRQDHLTLLAMIEDNEGELTPELEEMLCLSNDDFESKAISYAYVVKGFDFSTEVIDKEIKRLQDLKAKSEKRKELFKQRLSEAMQQFGIEKIDNPLMKLSFRKSESVEITDEEKISSDYTETKVVTTISKTKIKEAIKEGLKVEGAELVTKQNLQIK